MNPFAIGNLAVYHGKGVGLITGLQTKDPRGNPSRICKLDLKKSSAQVRVDHPSQTTIRTVMSDTELEGVYDILREQDIKPNKTTWNRRYRGYIQNINSGIPELIAGVLRDLELLGITKSLSFGESKIYADAKELIVEEGAYTLMVPTLNEFLLPFNNVKAHSLLQNLNAVLQKSVKDDAFDFSAKGLKDISNLTLSLPTDVEEGEHKFIHLFNALITSLMEVEKEANKIIMRIARKALNAAHTPNKEKIEAMEECFQILVPWKNISLVGVLEPMELYKHKSYESLKNLFTDKGCLGLESFDLEAVVKPMVEFANYHLLLQLRDSLADLDLKRERKRRRRVKPKPLVRKSLREKEPQEQAPKILLDAIQEIEKVVKVFKPTLTKKATFEDIQEDVFNCFLELDTEVRMHSLVVTQVYLEENLDQYREVIMGQLDEIFKEARLKGEQEKEDKAKKKSKASKKKAEERKKAAEEKKAAKELKDDKS